MSGFERWVGKVAIVTGASSGIGADIAERLVKEGLKVVGLARRIERVEALSKKLSSERGKLHPIKCDMSKEEEILAAFEWTKQNVGHVSILINNAGTAPQSTLIGGETAAWRQIFDVNVVAILICTREAVKGMKENSIDGHIVNINSVAGHYPHYLPDCSVYSASKHAVTTLSENYRREFHANNLKIKVTSVSPGLVDTEMPSDKFLKSMVSLKGEDIVDGVIYVLSTKPHVHVPELMIRPYGGEY
ncbi:unnamed protein product [Brassicogethes aeneus]|uniref:Dehydrogenase/reductase SDR family member 11 n=1 Tax=Brassicogethes aeneus TaxID=1431903 RepID=A0A9P0FKP5_BRAAE|nr:unnamed protein product [Brassicogethes aeneus]